MIHNLWHRFILISFPRSTVDGPKAERRLCRSRAYTQDPGRTTVHVRRASVEPKGRVGVQQRRVRRSGVRVEPVSRADGDLVQRRVQRADPVRHLDTGAATRRVSTFLFFMKLLKKRFFLRIFFCFVFFIIPLSPLQSNQQLQ